MFIVICGISQMRGIKISIDQLLPKSNFHKNNKTENFYEKFLSLMNSKNPKTIRNNRTTGVNETIKKLEIDNQNYKNKITDLESKYQKLSQQNNDILKLMNDFNEKINNIQLNQNKFRKEIDQISEEIKNISLELSLFEKSGPSVFSDFEKIHVNITDLSNRLSAIEIATKNNNEEFYLIEIQKYLCFLLQKIENLEKFQVNIFTSKNTDNTAKDPNVGKNTNENNN